MISSGELKVGAGTACTPVCIVDDIYRVKDQGDFTISEDGCRGNTRDAPKGVLQPLDNDLTLVLNCVNNQSGMGAVLDRKSVV